MILTTALAAFLLSAHAASPAALPDLAIESHKLANGLTVILHEDHSSPIVAVNTWYSVGSKNEEAGRTGFAHLFEHYMFEGSAHAAAGEYFNKIFGMGGDTNANTTNDRTDYFAVVPSENLEEVLRQEADRMGFLNIDGTAGLDKQRHIVKNEKRLRENQPYGGAWEGINTTTWDKGHPYSWPVIGSMEDLGAASLEDVKKFHDSYYLPNNAVLVISGDQDNAATLLLVNKWYGTIPKGPAPPALKMPPISTTPGRRELTLEDDKAQMPLLLLSYRIPGKGKPGWQEVSVAAQILGGGRSSRLVQSLQYDKRLVLSVSASVMGLAEEDILLIEAMPAPGVQMKAVEDAIRAQLDAFAAHGPSEQEMARAKAGIRTATLNALQTAANVAAELAEGQALFNDPAYVLTALGTISEMPRANPQDAAKRLLTPSNTAVITIQPSGGSK
ncbi:MAG: pitrilysin family protein [Elusimicrobiota bacterium]